MFGGSPWYFLQKFKITNVFVYLCLRAAMSLRGHFPYLYEMECICKREE